MLSVIVRENADAQAASTDGRVTLYVNDQTHMFERASTDGRTTLYANDQANMFERKVVIKKQRGGFKYKKTKQSIFSFPT